MHEMALTQSLVELIEDEGRKQGFSRVRVVRLEIGALGSVEPEAMRFCFEAVARGAIVEGARLDIDVVPGEGWCLIARSPCRCSNVSVHVPSAGGIMCRSRRAMTCA